LTDQIFEDAATLFVVLKLVEAGASRSEKHDVAGARGVGSDFDGAFQRTGALDGHASGDLCFDFFRCRANQQHKNSFFA
jgi:hypothetical protein